MAINDFRADILSRWWNRSRKLWWCHQMEAFSALLALCVGNLPVTSKFPTQRAIHAYSDIFWVWVHISLKTKNQMTGDLRLHDVHMTSSYWSCSNLAQNCTCIDNDTNNNINSHQNFFVNIDQTIDSLILQIKHVPCQLPKLFIGCLRVCLKAVPDGSSNVFFSYSVQSHCSNQYSNQT